MEKEKHTSLMVGTRVSYGGQGVGTIISTTETPVYGVYVACYVVEFDTGNILQIPMAKAAVNLTIVTETVSVSDVVKLLLLPPAPLPKHWKHIDDKYRALLRAGSISDLAVVIRDMYPGTKLGRQGILSLYRAGLAQLVSRLVTDTMPKDKVLAVLREGTGFSIRDQDADPHAYVSNLGTKKSLTYTKPRAVEPVVKPQLPPPVVSMPKHVSQPQKLPRIVKKPPAVTLVAPPVAAQSDAKLLRRIQELEKQLEAQVAAVADWKQRAHEAGKALRDGEGKVVEAVRSRQQLERSAKEKEAALLAVLQKQEVANLFLVILLLLQTVSPVAIETVSTDEHGRIDELTKEVKRLTKQNKKLKQDRLTAAKIRRNIERVRRELFGYITKRTARIDELEEQLRADSNNLKAPP